MISLYIPVLRVTIPDEFGEEVQGGAPGSPVGKEQILLDPSARPPPVSLDSLPRLQEGPWDSWVHGRVGTERQSSGCWEETWGIFWFPKALCAVVLRPDCAPESTGSFKTLSSGVMEIES